MAEEAPQDVVSTCVVEQVPISSLKLGHWPVLSEIASTLIKLQMRHLSRGFCSRILHLQEHASVLVQEEMHI